MKARKVVNGTLTGLLFLAAVTMGMLSYHVVLRFGGEAWATALAGACGAIFVIACILWVWRRP